MVIRLFKNAPAAAFGCAAFTILSSGALAFFPPVPVASDEVKTSPIAPVVPVTPTPPAVVVVPPVPPPVVVTKEVPDPVMPSTCPAPVRPSDVPEPMTLISGIIGLSVLGAAVAKKKLRKSASPEAD